MRLIDADALKNALTPLEATGGHKYYRAGMETVLHEFMPKFIDDAPTIDAVPVAHGRWVGVFGRKYGNSLGVQCSECGRRVRNRSENYCPECGVKMDRTEVL